MEMSPFGGSPVKRRWVRRRSGYNKLSSTNSRSVKIERFGGSSKHAWRLRIVPKLRLVRLPSPLKLWHRFKNAYVKMMLRFADTAPGITDAASFFGSKRIPKGREASKAYSRAEFENRLMLEIYKSMVASLELGYKPAATTDNSNSGPKGF